MTHSRAFAITSLAALAVGTIVARAEEPLEPWNISAQMSRVVRSDESGRILAFERDVVITHGGLTATADHAEYLENLRRALLTGEVVMKQDSMVVRGPLCFYDRDTRIARFPYGVVVERPTGTVVADAGTWDRGTRKLELRGRVAAADTSGTLDADAATYDELSETLYAVGHARLVDEESGMLVESGGLRYEQRVPVGVATDAPVATFDDEGTPIRVAADEMRYDPRKNVGVAKGNVVLTRNTMRATGGSVTFVRNEDRVILEDKPTVIDGDSEITGDKIELITDSDERRRVRVQGSARVVHHFAKPTPAPLDTSAATDSTIAEHLDEALHTARDSLHAREAEIRAKAPDSLASPAWVDSIAGLDKKVSPQKVVTKAIAAVESAADSAHAAAERAKAGADSAKAELPEWLRTPGDRLPQENLLFGDELSIDVVKDQLTRVDVVGHGRSKFYPSQEEGDLTEWNDVVGDTLHVWFTESKIDSVTVLGRGTGEYRLPAKEDAGATEEVLRDKGKLVEYEAPEIRYDRKNQMMHLAQGGQVKYKTMQLRSGTIDFDADKEIMVAGGTPTPVLVDADEEITGNKMRYHLPSEKGEIIGGRTRFENAFYQGTDIWRMGDNVLAVENAMYTTCDLEDPHFHFASKEMKIYLGDRMVAKPVVLEIHHIPVFALPFYMASLKKGRHSGFLLPNLELGVDDSRGRFIKNIGYYWVPNDYADLTTSFDFYPSQDRVVSYLSGRYHLRYRFDGRVAVKYNRDVPNDLKDTAVELSHRQTISDTMDLSGDARFLSSSSIYQDIDDAQRLNRDIRSNLTLSKRFTGSNRSLRVDLQRQENLDENSFSELLPAIVFSQPSRPVMGGAVTAPQMGATGRERRLLEDLYWNVDARAVRQRSRSASVVDTVAAVEEEHRGAQSIAGLRMTRNVARYLRLSPSVDGEGTWIDEDVLGAPDETRATYRTSVAASTTLYGTFPHGVGPAKGFRHVIDPGVSWNWAPEFREYFFADSQGNLQDRFFSFGGITGTPRKSNSMGFSLRNLLQTKVDWKRREVRADLFQLRNNISYDFLAKDTGRKSWSSFSSTLNVLSALPVNQSWTVTHDPYTWDLLSRSVTTRARLSASMLGLGGRRVTPADSANLAVASAEGEQDDAVGGGTSAMATRAHPARGGSWAVDVSHTAQTTGSGGASSSLVFNSMWAPSDKWAVTFNTQYDLKSGENTAQSWSVHRIIHCWELSFDRRLLGGEWQYYLRVNVTDLPDIQAQRGDKFGGQSSSIPGSPLNGLF